MSQLSRSRVAAGTESLKLDFVIIFAYLALSGIGLLMIYSVTAPRLELIGENPAAELQAQAVWVLLGIIVFAVMSTIDLAELKGFAGPIYVIALVLLILVAIIGESDGVAQRWIDLGFIQFQPSEFAKLAVILMVASVLSASQQPLEWRTIAYVLILVGIPSGLIFLQPDLGTMLVFAFVALVLLFMGGATMRQISSLFMATIVGTVGLFQLDVIEKWQRVRLTAFISPDEHLPAHTFHQVQSEIAIGSGGLFGQGLFQGSQTNLMFIPVQSSDFIFTAVGEQFGFVGSVVVIALFAVLLLRLLIIATHARGRFSFLVTMGVAAMLMFHIFVNIGMTVRVMPVTGLPLPFMSAGGTVFVALSAALGLVHSVWIRRRSPVGE